MDHEAVCDCPFKAKCQTYNDPLIHRLRKGPHGLGCVGRNDVYRGKHCKTFACGYLSMVLSEMLTRKPAARTGSA